MMLVACVKVHSPGDKVIMCCPQVQSSHGRCQAAPIALSSGVALLSSKQAEIDSLYVTPKGAYEMILSGPQRLSKGERVKSHFPPVQLCQF